MNAIKSKRWMLKETEYDEWSNVWIECIVWDRIVMTSKINW